MDKDLTFECDYGVRTPIIDIITKFVDEYLADELQMIAVFANNNVYNLEFFLVFSFDKPRADLMQLVKQEFYKVGAKYRPDITLDELIRETLQNNRFNSFTIKDSIDIKLPFETYFHYKELKDVMKITSIRPLGDKQITFLSHTSVDKPKIEQLIPYLNAVGLNMFFDKTNIDYGESIVEKIQGAIKRSNAVIFWISNQFLNSNWCKREMNSFLTRFSSRKDVLILSIVESAINHDDLPIFIQELKYLRIGGDLDINDIGKELIPTLKRFFNERK